MVQSFNSSALGYLYRVLWNRSLVVPHYRAKGRAKMLPLQPMLIKKQDISFIAFSKLKQAGIKGIVFDKDNTLTTPYAPDIYPPLKPAYEECLRVFGDKVCIFSNSAGSSDDIDYKEAAKISEDLGIHVIRHTEKKPGGVTDVLDYLQCDAKEVATIGDRYFTDILFGNLHGMLTFYTAPLTDVNDNSVVKIIRPYEQWIVESWISQTAPEHTLGNNNEFLTEEPFK